MEFKFTWRYAIAFMAFVFVFGQLHEMAHLAAVRLICGCDGKQADFNLWTVSENCRNPNSYLATLFGPLFSVAMMWAGYLLLNRGGRYHLAGWVLIMGNLPFARLFTAAIGGGDEKTVLRVWLADQSLIIVKIMAFVVVCCLCFPPLYRAYRVLPVKNRWMIVIGFSVLPLLFMKLYEFMLLGRIIRAGFLAQWGFLGIADFIYLHTALMTLVVLMLGRTLFGLRRAQ